MKFTENKYFVDTNILLYAHDREAGSKHHQARQILEKLWEAESGVLSIQVLNELSAVLFSKFKLNTLQVRSLVEPYLRVWWVIPLQPQILSQALLLKQRYSFSFWDSLIVQAALEAECSILLSEDLSHNQRIGSLVIKNPFKETHVRLL